MEFKISTKESSWYSAHCIGNGERTYLRNKNASFKVFGVVGVAGIGKTTLCQALFARDPVKERYSPRIWVCLSKQPKDRSSDYKKEIVVRILKCLGIDDEAIDDAVKDEKYGLKKLILLLRLQLIETRYLIVVDDAWNDNKFFHDLTQGDPLDDTWGEALAYGLPKGCGGTIISSSASEALLKDMLGKDVKMQHLKELDDEIIYNIFKDAVIGYDEEEREFLPDLDSLKDEMLTKCAGVPFAAKLLAKIACKQLEIKPKSQQPKGVDVGSHDIGLPMVRHNQMASTSTDNK
ncbi:putative disease resistance protein At4g19060 [Bidens hawaiensis]|uniref:putative disease resistance protein At4g19060 n=1 Tax=Bidens hawaiensis TaxID=980011 RepID=UPI0040493950